MENREKYAYFYNKSNKTESIGTVESAHNWGTAKNDVERVARKYLPKGVEEFRILDVGRQGPLGALMVDMLSLDFAGIMDFFGHRTLNWDEKLTQDDLEHLPDDLLLLTTWKETMSWKDLLEDSKRLYIIRRYVDMCAECPRLYSIGQFQCLLRTIYERGWWPKAIGFFAPIDISKTRLSLLSDREFHEADYYGDSYAGLCDLSDLDRQLEYNLLGWSKDAGLSLTDVEVFEFSGVVEMALLSLFHLIQEQIAIKKCANCGKLFVPLARADAIYCDRMAPQDGTKTCKTYGSKVLWYENVMSDDVTKLARNVYSAKQMLVKRNPDKAEYAEMFEYFKVERKKWEEQVKAGTKTREEYSEWLRKIKLCKTKAELSASARQAAT